MASAKVSKTRQRSAGKRDGSPDKEQHISLDSLDILKTIGTGTFGRVVLTRHKESKEYSALKVMIITQVIKLKQEDHIMSEKQILASICHPFLVNLYEDPLVMYSYAEHRYGLYKRKTIVSYEDPLVMYSYAEHHYGLYKRKTIVSYEDPLVMYSYAEHRYGLYKRKTIVRLWSHKDDTFLYMLMEYVPGGELFSYLRNIGRFGSLAGNFYASEIIVALEYLHAKSIVYRDLKPENLLLDREGHLKITDFGFAKVVEDRTWTLCGTPEYLAPEIILSKGHNKAVDWWSLGVLIYEMLAGYPPYYAENPFGIYEKIIAGKIEWPKHIDSVAKDLIKKLLNPDRTRRLGNMKNGPEDVKKHKWFKGQNWDDVLARKLQPPIVPKLSHDGDTTNFETYDEDDWRSTTAASEEHIKRFEDF